MEVAASSDDLQISSMAPDDSVVPEVPNPGDVEPKHDVSEKEAKGILEVIASTGKFWHEWEKLKAVLSFQLKQVMLEYPEAKMTTEEQNASLGDTFAELMKRLDEALHNFDQGPPFTLQRLCEILLDARGIYPKLSKLALALDKNLSVTSMLTISADPYPQSIIVSNKTNEEEQEMQSNGGVDEHVRDERDDEVMTEADFDDNMTVDTEALENIVGGASQTSITPPTETQ